MLVLGLLSGCNTVQTELVLQPVQLGTKTQARADRVGACFGLDRSVIQPSHLALDASQLGAGYENVFIRGADPAPCNLRRNYSHQGAIQFDLSEVTRRHATVIEAVLDYDVTPGFRTEGADDIVFLNLSTQPWTNGNFFGPLNVADNRTQLTVAPMPRTDDRTLEPLRFLGGHFRPVITQTVRQWLHQGRPYLDNNGIVLATAPAHSFAEDNSSSITLVTNIRLRLKLLEPAP